MNIALVDPYRKSGNPFGPPYYPGSGKLIEEVFKKAHNF